MVPLISDDLYRSSGKKDVLGFKFATPCDSSVSALFWVRELRDWSESLGSRERSGLVVPGIGSCSSAVSLERGGLCRCGLECGRRRGAAAVEIWSDWIATHLTDAQVHTPHMRHAPLLSLSLSLPIYLVFSSFFCLLSVVSLVVCYVLFSSFFCLSVCLFVCLRVIWSTACPMLVMCVGPSALSQTLWHS